MFIALVVGLAWVGYTASRRITAGENLDVRDPNEPNYVAEVKPTPVDLVAFTGPDNRLAAAAVVTAGAGGKGGTVVPIPADVGVRRCRRTGRRPDGRRNWTRAASTNCERRSVTS